MASRQLFSVSALTAATVSPPPLEVLSVIVTALTEGDVTTGAAYNSILLRASLVSITSGRHADEDQDPSLYILPQLDAIMIRSRRLTELS